MDNLVMIQAGEMIDISLGVTFGLSTLTGMFLVFYFLACFHFSCTKKLYLRLYHVSNCSGWFWPDIF